MTDDQLLDLLHEVQARLTAVEAELQRRVPAAPDLQRFVESSHGIQDELGALSAAVREALSTP